MRKNQDKAKSYTPYARIIFSLFVVWMVGVVLAPDLYAATVTATGTATANATMSSADHGNNARALASELYCSVKGAMSGESGIFFGLFLSALAVITMIFTGFSKKAVVLFVAGLVLTALPAAFETFLEVMESIMSPMGSGGNTLASTC